jgi:hypothetical protein
LKRTTTRTKLKDKDLKQGRDEVVETARVIKRRWARDMYTLDSEDDVESIEDD